MLAYLIPLFLVAVPSLFQGRVNLRFSMRDTIIGVSPSVLFLSPYLVFMSLRGKAFTCLPLHVLFFQLFGVAFPEEIYFRGLLQERLGNDMKGLVLVSFLFSLTHLPQYLVHGDPYVLMTFFPSLVMGYLYMRTSNILPSTIFHFLANVLFLSS